MQTILLKPFVHRGQQVIGIATPYVRLLDLAIRKLKGVKWSQTNKLWYLPLREEAHQQIMMALKALANIDESLLRPYLEKRQQVMVLQPLLNKENKVGDAKSKTIFKPAAATKARQLSEDNLKALERFLEHLKLKAYSASTIRTYRNEFMQLLLLLKNKKVNNLAPDDLKRYFIYCFEKLHLTENTLDSRISAIKFYFEQVLTREKFFWEIPRPKKQLQLPGFFNQDEVTAILKSAGTLKHKTMLMLAYGAGMRVSEVVSLKTHHIDGKRMCILIEQAKGKKDRMVGLSAVLLVMLREYWKEYKPSNKGFLFEGQNKGEPYTTRSLQLVIAEAKRKAGILKPGSVHALRHSFATHLLDKGTDVVMIMKLLGHNDIKTTLRYLHISNRDMLQVISPLDDLQL